MVHGLQNTIKEGKAGLGAFGPPRRAGPGSLRSGMPDLTKPPMPDDRHGRLRHPVSIPRARGFGCHPEPGSSRPGRRKCWRKRPSRPHCKLPTMSRPDHALMTANDRSAMKRMNRRMNSHDPCMARQLSLAEAEGMVGLGFAFALPTDSQSACASGGRADSPPGRAPYDGVPVGSWPQNGARRTVRGFAPRGHPSHCACVCRTPRRNAREKTPLCWFRWRAGRGRASHHPKVAGSAWTRPHPGAARPATRTVAVLSH